MLNTILLEVIIPSILIIVGLASFEIVRKKIITIYNRISRAVFCRI